MALFEIWRVDPLPRGYVKKEVLGRIRANHAPDAMLKAYRKWPDLAHGERLTARPVTWLNKMRRARNIAAMRPEG